MQIICMTGFRLMSLLKIVLAALVLDGFTLALAMEVSPELHQKIHHDADDGDHECLATQMQHSGLEGVLVACVPVAVDQVWSEISWTGRPIRVASFFLGCSIYEHGPPVRTWSISG